MKAEFWNRRYTETDYAYGTEANDYLKYSVLLQVLAKKRLHFDLRIIAFETILRLCGNM